jgi:hypothetical protein
MRGGTPSITTATLPGTTVIRNPSSPNRYIVTFPRSVTGCIPVASATPTLGGTVSEQLSTSTAADVATLTTAGSPATNVDFNLMIVC